MTRFGVDIDLGDRTAGSLLYIAAQAAVEDTLTGERQTAWGDGSRFQGTNWATYISYELRVSCPCFDPDVVFDSFPADWFSATRSVSCFKNAVPPSLNFTWKLHADGVCASPDPVLEGATTWSPVTVVGSCRYFDDGSFGPAVSVAHGDLTEEQVMACADAVTDAMRAAGLPLGADVCDESCTTLEGIDPEAP